MSSAEFLSTDKWCAVLAAIALTAADEKHQQNLVSLPTLFRAFRVSAKLITVHANAGTYGTATLTPRRCNSKDSCFF